MSSPASTPDKVSDTVLVGVEGPVGRITLNAPERLNAVDEDMLERVAEAVTDLDARDDVRVIALAGAGRGFCSGANLKGDPSGGAEIPTGTLYAGGRAIRAIVASRTPVVALVGGVAAGIGCSLALACDYVVAGESASFVLAFAKIGLMPDGGATALVAASIGRARAMRMALTAEKVSATDAHAWGLVAESVPDEQLAERSAAVLELLAGRAPRATAATTAAINAATLDLDAALHTEEVDQVRLLGSADAREGVTAFLERRAPRFTGS